MVSKLDLQTYTSEFESHWAPLSYGLVPHLSKKSLVNYHAWVSSRRKIDMPLNKETETEAEG